MSSNFFKSGLNLLRFIYPSMCCYCGLFMSKDEVFCEVCFEKISPTAAKTICLNKKYSIKVHSVCLYEGPIKSLILKKSSYRRGIFADKLASIQLAKIIDKKINIKSLDADFIVPVPLHWSRYAWRGFNQSYVKAKFLSKKTKIPMINILKKIRKTDFQSKLSKELRQKNVNDAFVIRKKYCNHIREIIENKNILIIDDLCTTGATLKNVAKPLCEGMPKSISALVACRVD